MLNFIPEDVNLNEFEKKNLFIRCQRCLVNMCSGVDCNNKIGDIVCRNVSLFKFKVFYSIFLKIVLT